MGFFEGIWTSFTAMFKVGINTDITIKDTIIDTSQVLTPFEEQGNKVLGSSEDAINLLSKTAANATDTLSGDVSSYFENLTFWTTIFFLFTCVILIFISIILALYVVRKCSANHQQKPVSSDNSTELNQRHILTILDAQKLNSHLLTEVGAQNYKSSSKPLSKKCCCCYKYEK